MNMQMKKYLTHTILTIILLFFTDLNYGQEVDKITASDISKAIDLDLMLDDYVSSHMIDVNTAEGIVTLSGNVSSLFEKERATKIAESILGVRSVINKINVVPKFKTDKDLKSDIELALLLDPVVSSYDLKVDVQNGIATLRGNVSSWTEMELASNVVKNVYGVKDFKNEVEIDYERNFTDLEIQEAINRKLKLDPYVDESLVSVMVDNGDVRLDGTVGSAAEKSMLVSDSWVAGVKSVNNEDVNILFWAEDKMKRKNKFTLKDDNEIKQAVHDAFKYDPRVSNFNIDISVENGYVTLNGVVNNLKSKRSAKSDALNTIGVIGVENMIKVRPMIKVINTEIESSIEHAFSIDPLLNNNNLHATVENNKAYLYGTVKNYSEKVHATNVASSIMGVVDVENNIDVLKKWNYKADNVIRENIEDEYFWSLLVDSDDITVTVENGVATLSGKVSSLPEYKSAIENAFEGGAKSVMSKLEIESNTDFGDRIFYPNSPMMYYNYF